MYSEKNQILELRQLGSNTLQYVDDSTGQIRNGDFKTRLKKSVLLNNKDTLRLNQVFLQTTELEQDQIVISKDLKLRVSFTRYMRNNINKFYPTQDQLINTTQAGETIKFEYTPSVIMNQNSFSVYGGGTIPSGTGPQAGNFCLYEREGKILLECKSTSSDTIDRLPLKFYQLKSITFKKIDFLKPTTEQTIYMEYKTVLGDLSTITLKIPALTNQTSHVINFNLIGQEYNFKYITIINLKQLADNNLFFDSFERGNAIFGYGNAIVTPVSNYREIIVEAGTYHASELATYITNKMTDTGLEGIAFKDSTTKRITTGNNLLGIADNETPIAATQGQLYPSQTPFRLTDNIRLFANGSDFNVYGSMKTQKHSGQDTIEPIQNRPNILCGSDSFALIYDDSVSKFKLSKIHYSIYDLDGKEANQILDNDVGNGYLFYTNSGGGQFIGSVLDRDGNQATDSYLGVAHGGILIQSLTAFDNDTGEFNNFWEDILGFDTEKLSLFIDQEFTTHNTPAHEATKHALTANTDLGTNYFTQIELLATFSIDPIDGIHITTDKASISALHYLNSQTLQSNGTIRGSGNSINIGTLGYRYFNGLSSNNYDTSITQYNAFLDTTLTSQIFARDQLKQDNINFAYYLIDISAKMDNEYVTDDDVKRNIFSAINRYYISGGYLSGTNSGIEYIHEGESIIISDFDVRILKPDGSLAENLKSDNTVFLEVIRSEPE